MARGVTLAASAAMLAIACNAITGVSDLGIADGTSSPTVSGPRTDGGPIENESGPSTDGAPTGDSGTVVVTDPDGGADADAAPLGFCASLSPAPSLCTDFDDNVFPGPWTPTLVGPGTAALVTSTFRSSPRALQLGSPGVTSGTAFLSRTFATVAQSEVVLGFSIRAGQQRPIENELAVIFLGSAGGNPYQVQLELLDNGVLNLEEEAPDGAGAIAEKNEPLGINLTIGQWTRVTITLAIGLSSSTVTFDIEGSAPVTKTALAHNYKAAPRIVLGHDSATTAAYAMTYDDVFVRVK
jgi:hypothetical protein